MTLESNSAITDQLITGATNIVNSRNEERRRQQRERRAQRSSREGNRAAAEEFLASDEASFKSKGRETDTERALRLGQEIAVDLDDEAWAFGEDPSYMGGEARPQDATQTYTRDEKVREDVLPSEFLTDDEKAAKREGYTVLVGGKNPVEAKIGSGTAAMSDALGRLKQAKEQFGYDLFGSDGPAMQANEEYLEFELDPDVQRKRDRYTAQQAVLEDARIRSGNLTDDEIAREVSKRIDIVEGSRQPGYDASPEGAALEAELLRRRADANSVAPALRAMQVEARAANDAEAIRNRLGGLPRQLADEDIGRIGEIYQLGGAQAKVSHDPMAGLNYRVGREIDASAFGNAIPLKDKDGNIREYYGYEDGGLVQLGEVNIDSSDQVLNAPKPTAGQSFVAETMPSYGKPGGTTFGFPQVGINEELHLLGDRVRGLKGYGLERMGDPRSLDDFEKVMSGIVGRAQEQGDSFWKRDETTGKNVAVANPQIPDVLSKLGYSPAESERLANALFQTQAARVEGTNSADKDAYYGRSGTRPGTQAEVNLDVAEMRPDGGLQLQKLENEKIGRGKKARSAKAALAGISDEKTKRDIAKGGPLTAVVGPNREALLPEAARAISGANQARNDAQMPLIGSLADDPVERSRFMKAEDRGLTEAQLIKKYGGARGVQAAEIERRFIEDEKLRRQAAIADDPIAAEFRNRESSIRAKSGLPADPSLTAPRQPIQPASTPGIAPIPGDTTGNQSAPLADAGGGIGRQVPGMDYNWDDADVKPSVPADIKEPIVEAQSVRAATPASGAQPDGPAASVSDERKRRFQESNKSAVRKFGRQTRRELSRPRARIGGGVALSAGALAGILGLAADDSQEEAR